MTDAIRPALTPEEWADGKMRSRFTESLVEPHITTDVRGGRHMAVVAFDRRWIVARAEGWAALANHALPDGHPNKFTRADVERLRLLLGAFEPDDNVRGWLPNLAARIEALLPPEGV